MFPAFLPDADKKIWSHNDCFLNNTSTVVKGFVHQNYGINMHSHDFYELNLVLKGKGVHYINSNVFQIDQGDLFIIPPGYKHGYYMLEGLDVYHLLIHQDFFIKYRFELEPLPGYIMLLTVEPIFRKKMNYRYFLELEGEDMKTITLNLIKVAEANNSNGLEAPVMANTMALYTIALICKLYREQYSITDHVNQYFSAILNSIEYIYARYTDKISIDDLVNISHLSRSTFIRIFLKSTGCTPNVIKLRN